MPYADNDGTRIHFQLVGSGPPLLLLHGSFADLGDWHEAGYVDGLKKNYQLILMDARGHGSSDKPQHREAYDTDKFVGDMVAILDHLGIDKSHFFGYSFGGKMGFGIPKYAPDRVQSLIIGGSHPYRRNPASHDVWGEALEKGVDEFSTVLGGLFDSSLSGYKVRRLSGDFEAFIPFNAEMSDYPGFEDELANISVPCLLYAGDADGNYSSAKECAKGIPNAEFISFPGLDHIQTFVRSELVILHIINFLANVH